MMNVMTNTVIVMVALHYCFITTVTEAWSMVEPPPQPQKRSTVTDNHDTKQNNNNNNMPVLADSLLHRRNFVSSIIRTTTTTSAIGISSWMMMMASVPAQAAVTTSAKVTEAIQELKESRDKLKEIPDLLEAKEWDKVRSILKVPPVNKLWNLGDVGDAVVVAIAVLLCGEAIEISITRAT